MAVTMTEASRPAALKSKEMQPRSRKNEARERKPAKTTARKVKKAPADRTRPVMK